MNDYLVMDDLGNYPAIEARGYDEEAAAREAMETWNRRGKFSGDPFPTSLDLLVKPGLLPWDGYAPDRAAFLADGDVPCVVHVSVDWVPVYRATKAKTAKTNEGESSP